MVSNESSSLDDTAKKKRGFEVYDVIDVLEAPTNFFPAWIVAAAHAEAEPPSSPAQRNISHAFGGHAVSGQAPLEGPAVTLRMEDAAGHQQLSSYWTCFPIVRVVPLVS